jgi:hypothetical protein
MLKSLVAGILALLAESVACVAETNSPSFSVATNAADFVHFMKVNQQRTQKGLKPIPIQVSPQLDEKLVSNGTLPSFDQYSPSVSLRFKNTPLQLVLEQYTALTGSKVVIPKGLSLPITLSTKRPVPEGKAIVMIEQTLASGGVVLERVDKTTLRASREAKTKDARQAESTVPSEPAPSASSDVR